MSAGSLTYERRGAIAIATIDDAPYNRMSLAFMDALEPLGSEDMAESLRAFTEKRRPVFK